MLTLFTQQAKSKYKFVLFNAIGDVIWEKIIQKESEEDKIEYSYGANEATPVLLPEVCYFWQVSALESENSGYESNRRQSNLCMTSGMAYFIAMPAIQIETINETLMEAQQQFDETTSDEIFTLYLGAYYETNGLYAKAQAEYEKLIRLDPGNKFYERILANLYIKIGRKWKAFELLPDLYNTNDTGF